MKPEVILEKLKSIHAQNELHHKFSERQFKELRIDMSKITGAVSANTAFRLKLQGSFKLVCIIGGVLVGLCAIVGSLKVFL